MFFAVLYFINWKFSLTSFQRNRDTACYLLHRQAISFLTTVTPDLPSANLSRCQLTPMCHQVNCRSCKKPTWFGCGHHIDSALGNVCACWQCSVWRRATRKPVMLLTRREFD